MGGGGRRNVLGNVLGDFGCLMDILGDLGLGWFFCFKSSDVDVILLLFFIEIIWENIL